MEPKRRRVAAPVRIADEDGVCSQGRRQGEHIFAAGEIPGGASRKKSIAFAMLFFNDVFRCVERDVLVSVMYTFGV